MATIKSTLALEDRMTPTLSKASKQAIENIKAYQALEKQIDMLGKATEDMEKAGLSNSKMFEDTVNAIEDVQNSMREYEDGIRNASDEQDDLKISATELNQTLEILGKGWDILREAVAKAQEYMELNDEQFDSQFTLASKMHTVLGASKDEINSMYEYTAALQENGIIGDETLMRGAKLLATSASSTEKLKELTRAAADAAVAEYGIQDASSGFTSMAQYMQRALEGNASMFVRNGILTKQEADYIDNLSSKTEKENALIRAFNKYLGQNAKAAETAQGQIKSADNALGDLGETIGEKVTPYFAGFKRFIVELTEPLANFVSQNEWVIAAVTGAGIALGFVILVITLYSVVTGIASAATSLFGASAVGAALKFAGLALVIGVLIGILLYLWETNDDAAYYMLLAWDGFFTGIRLLVTGAKVLWIGLVSIIGTVITIILTAVQAVINAFVAVANAGIGVANLFGANMEYRKFVSFGTDFGKGLDSYVKDLSKDVKEYSQGTIAEIQDNNASREARVQNREKLGPQIKEATDTITDAINKKMG